MYCRLLYLSLCLFSLPPIVFLRPLTMIGELCGTEPLYQISEWTKSDGNFS
jgi:hypothetical protein